MLETKELTVAFGGLVAVNQVDLSVSPGEILGMIGPNGAGKTTFFNLLTGFLTPTSGRILFKGKDIAGLPPSRIASLGLCRTFQITSIFPGLTVWENLLTGTYCWTQTRFLDTILRSRGYGGTAPGDGETGRGDPGISAHGGAEGYPGPEPFLRRPAAPGNRDRPGFPEGVPAPGRTGRGNEPRGDADPQPRSSGRSATRGSPSSSSSITCSW